MTPTVLRVGPYRLFFYSSDRQEPPHIHVARDTREAKFWLKPVECSYNDGFAAQELRRIERIVQEREQALLEAWDAYFP